MIQSPFYVNEAGSAINTKHTVNSWGQTLKQMNSDVYLVFDHGAEVIVPEKHTEFSFLHGGRELT